MSTSMGRSSRSKGTIALGLHEPGASRLGSKSAKTSGRSVSWLTAAILTLGLSTMLLAGCGGSDGSDGQPGAVGPEGLAGPSGPPGQGGSPGPIGHVTPTLKILDAYIENNRPVVEFEVVGGQSWPASTFEPSPANVEFTIARLVDHEGYQTWQSYINTTAGGPRAGPHARLQASSVRGNHAAGTWQALGGNAYRFTYPINVSTVPTQYQNNVAPVAASDWVPASEVDVRRFVVLLRPGENYDAAYDFADAGLGDTKRSVATASCNSCHDKLAAHGNSRIGVETCSNCHNQFTFSSFTTTANAIDLAYLGHEIHSGGGMASTQPNLRPRYTGVHYPRDIKSCSACHDGAQVGATAAARAFANPSLPACSSCHDNVNFATGVGHDAITDSYSCVNCHAPGQSQDAQIAHVDGARRFAKDGNLRYVIDSAALNGDELTVTWRAVHGATNIVHGTDGWQLGTTLRVGWYGSDFSHSDPVSRRPGMPVEVNAVQGATQSGGVYTRTVNLAGKGAGGNLMVTLGGNVGGGGHPGLVASNAIHFVGTPRRQVVSNVTCGNCHEDRFGAFNKHGASRHNDVRQCMLCHNNNSTDIDRRTHNPRPYLAGLGGVFPDGKAEQATNFMEMVHGLHGAAAGFREGDMWIPGNSAWSRWNEDSSFPGRLSNCRHCHLGTSYYPVARSLDPRGTTGNTRVDAGILSHEVDRHWKTTATMAACGSCHDSSDARAHMSQNGGESGWDQPTISASSWESCATCHAAGRVADVKKVHNVP
jgi:OmcA/MtrC family decaheme c-type cytochrome